MYFNHIYSRLSPATPPNHMWYSDFVCYNDSVILTKKECCHFWYSDLRMDHDLKRQHLFFLSSGDIFYVSSYSIGILELGKHLSNPMSDTVPLLTIDV